MKPVYTIRVTAIEAFRQFLYCGDNEDTPWINEPNVINTVMGIESTNIKADYGTAGHSIIEDPKKYRVNIQVDTNEFNTIASAKDIIPDLEPIYVYKVNDFVFTNTQVSPLMDFRAAHPLMTREIPLAKFYTTPFFDIIVTGTCDHLEGNVVRDTKFKFGNFDVADFMDSVQWKLYLDMLGVKQFVYDFFKVTGFDSMADMAKSRIGKCESMPLQSYSGMQDDIQTVLYDFAEWITFKGLQEHLVIDKKKANRILAGNQSLRKYIVL